MNARQNFHLNLYAGDPSTPDATPVSARPIGTLYDNRMSHRFMDEDSLMADGLAFLENKVGKDHPYVAELCAELGRAERALACAEDEVDSWAERAAELEESLTEWQQHGDEQAQRAASAEEGGVAVGGAAGAPAARAARSSVCCGTTPTIMCSPRRATPSRRRPRSSRRPSMRATSTAARRCTSRRGRPS